MNVINTHPLKTRVILLGYTQEQVAVALGIDPSLLGRYLRGIRPMPDGFATRAHAVLDRLAEAERAAQEARERVLAGAATAETTEPLAE